MARDGESDSLLSSGTREDLEDIPCRKSENFEPIVSEWKCWPRCFNSCCCPCYM